MQFTNELSLHSPPTPGTLDHPTTTISLTHKVPNGKRTLKLPVEVFTTNPDFDKHGITFLILPDELKAKLSILQTLPYTSIVDLEAVSEARLALEAWYHEAIVSCKNYNLRHIIVRDSHANPELLTRKPLAVQKPGPSFHIDADHTELVNLWLPLEDTPLSDYLFGE